MARIVAPTEPGVLLLELVVGGVALRYAERPLEVAGQRWTGGLSLSFTEEVELSASGPPVREVSVQIADDGDWSARAALGRSWGRVYLWAGGSTKELLLRGRVETPAIADPELPQGVVAFKLAEVEGEARGLLMEAALVDATTFPIVTPTGFTGDDIPSAYADAYYPEVIGRPGYPFPTWFTAEGVAPGSPAVWAQHGAAPLFDDKTLIIAKRGSSRVSSARLWDQNGATDGGDLLQVTDLRGQVVTVFDQSTLTTTEPATPDDVSTGWAVGWTAPPTTGPGGALRGLGDVLIWALERAGVDRPDTERGIGWEIDWASLVDCRASLNRFKIDTYISEQVDVWEWLARDILPFYPVFVGRSGRGIYVAEWRYHAHASEAVVHIERGRNAHRISTLAELDSQDVATAITAGFGLDVRSGKPIRTATISGAAVRSTLDTDQARHPLLERAWSEHGRRAVDIDVPISWDLASGYEILEYLAVRYAATLREVWYRMPWQYLWVRPGMVVKITDDETPLSATVGTVTARTPGPGCVDVRVLVHPST